MKSKLKFDLTEENLPCIYFEVDNTSDDLRDKVASKFFEELGGNSMWLNVTFRSELDHNGKFITRKGIITPISRVEIVQDQVNWWLEPTSDNKAV